MGSWITPGNIPSTGLDDSMLGRKGVEPTGLCDAGDLHCHTSRLGRGHVASIQISKKKKLILCSSGFFYVFRNNDAKGELNHECKICSYAGF